MFVQLDTRPNHFKTETIGKKAASLLELIQMGLPVPTGTVLTTVALDAFLRANDLHKPFQNLWSELTTDGHSLSHDALADRLIPMAQAITTAPLPESIRTPLSEFLTKNPAQHFAVRSSGTKEDLANASFAGLYQSVLNVKGIEDISTAIKTCWASLCNERVVQYCINQHIPLQQLSLGVVIQEMIPADASGVLFSVNPISGADREMVVEACFGLGEALVSGNVTPDHYRYNWFSEQIIEHRIETQLTALLATSQPPYVTQSTLTHTHGSQAVLDDASIKELCSLALQVQVGYGFPVDIEWVRYKDQFYIVQSRPITTINHNGIDGEWTTADFKDGGVSSSVCSRFMWSLYDDVWEVASKAVS